MGVTACGLIAAVTAVTFYLRYYGDGDVSHLISGLAVVVVYSTFAYGILRMSRAAASGALLLFAADKVYSFVVSGASLGIALFLAWYLIQANRAVYWFHKEADRPLDRGTSVRKCDHCGAEYRPSDYRVDASVWSCSQCHATLPREQPLTFER
jgi:hypothetical protein